MTTTASSDDTASRTGWRESMGWIRPWYVGAVLTHPINDGQIEAHIYPDCERLLAITSEPREGSGWLNPSTGYLCGACDERHQRADQPAPHPSGQTTTFDLAVEASA